MTEKEARSLFMDYLYDEMDSSEKQEFETYIENHADLTKELNELKGTRSLLQQVPLETPSHKLVMMTPERDTDHRFLRGRYLRAAVAIAATFLMIVLSFAMIDLQVGSSGSGFYVAFGDAPAAANGEGMSEEEVYGLIEQIREENALLLASVVEQSQQQQQLQLEQTIETLTEYYDQRRRQDLLLISEGLAQLEEETYYRFMQTDETLGDLIYALSYQQNQTQQP